MSTYRVEFIPALGRAEYSQIYGKSLGYGIRSRAGTFVSCPKQTQVISRTSIRQDMVEYTVNCQG